MIDDDDELGAEGGTETERVYREGGAAFNLVIWSLIAFIILNKD